MGSVPGPRSVARVLAVALTTALAAGCAGLSDPEVGTGPASATPPAAGAERPEGVSPPSPGTPEADTGRGEGRGSSLEGPEWIVTELDGEALVERSTITLTFEGGQLSGVASCNRYVAEWDPLPAGRIRIGSARSTLRACAPTVMDQERKFMELLSRFETVRFSEEGELVLTTASGATLRALPS